MVLQLFFSKELKEAFLKMVSKPFFSKKLKETFLNRSLFQISRASFAAKGFMTIQPDAFFFEQTFGQNKNMFSLLPHFRAICLFKMDLVKSVRSKISKSFETIFKKASLSFFEKKRNFFKLFSDKKKAFSI